jgi:membrane protease YdiL (CAAX protease family)
MHATPHARGVLAYLAITFAGAWAAWAVALVSGVHAEGLAFQALVLPGALAPALAAIVVRRWVTREGFADAGLRLNLRGHTGAYLLAWLFPLLAAAVIVALAIVLGVGQPDWSLRRGFGALVPGAPLTDAPFPALPTLVPALLVQAVVVTPLLWGEEFGWRGYLQVRLLADRPLAAAVATGAIWGLWHYPLILAGYEQYANRWLGLVVFTVFTVLLSIIFGWLRLRTGSVWAPSLAHSATNAVGGSLTLLLFAGGTDLMLVGYHGVLAWAPLGGLAAWIVLGGRLDPGASPPSARGPDQGRAETPR